MRHLESQKSQNVSKMKLFFLVNNGTHKFQRFTFHLEFWMPCDTYNSLQLFISFHFNPKLKGEKNSQYQENKIQNEAEAMYNTKLPS